MIPRMNCYGKTVFFTLFFFLLISPLYSQNYPNKIRGYKVYQTKISVKTDREKDIGSKNNEAVVKIGEPEITDISLTGIILEASAEIDGVRQNGKVDFLTFENFKVNGLKVNVEEYKESFELKKDQKLILPKPVKMSISIGQTLQGAYKESKDSKNEWTVSGTVFVFGKFRKFGFDFKRVIPVEINIKIENPLKKKVSQNDPSK